MMTVWETIAVLAGGGLAAVLRYLVAVQWVRTGHDSLRRSFPAPVLVVNTVGSLLAGVATAWEEQGELSTTAAVLLVTGVAGGLTTFSTWGVETFQNVHAGRVKTAAASVGANLVLGILAGTLGYLLGHALPG
jgi:fluoride exporter